MTAEILELMDRRDLYKSQFNVTNNAYAISVLLLGWEDKCNNPENE